MELVMAQELLKDLFAAALLREPDNAFGAACKVFGTDTISAMRAAQYWPSDIYVLTKQAELLDEFGEDSFLPNRATLARKIFELAETPNIDKKDKIKAFELYGNIMGYISKQTAISNVTLNENRVMIVKDFGNDEQWERAAVGQQTKLIEHSRD
jgi:hypothetical protein